MRHLTILAFVALASIGVTGVAEAQWLDGDFLSARVNLGTEPWSGFYSKTDPKDCERLAEAYEDYNRRRTEVHSACINAHSKEGFASTGDEKTGCSFKGCADWHGAKGGKEISACYAEVAAHQKEEQKKKAAEAEIERKKKAAASSNDSSSSSSKPSSKPEPPKREEPKPREERSRSSSRPSSDDRAAQREAERAERERERDRERKEREEAAERQRKADERALDFARKESFLEKLALAERTDKREAEKEWTEGRLAEALTEFGTELQQIRDRANTAVARLADSFSNPLTLDPTPPSITDNSGNVTSAFDFSSLNPSTSPGVDTSVIDTIGMVGEIFAPFAATPFTFIPQILNGSLKTFDQLSQVMSNFDRATPADIERIWQDYGQRVWSPEQWISKIVIDTAVGAVGHYALKAIVPEPEVLARDLADSLAGHRTASGPIVFKVADEPGWWTGRTVTRQADDLRRDADGMPLLKDFTGNIYGYNQTTNRVSYSRTEMEQLVAHGDFFAFRENVSELKWTNNHAIVLPAGPMGPGGLYIEPKLHSSETRVFFPGQPQDQPLLENALRQFVYSPVEAGIGEALTILLNGPDPDNPRTEKQLSDWLKALAADIDAKKRGVRQ